MNNKEIIESLWPNKQPNPETVSAIPVMLRVKGLAGRKFLASATTTSVCNGPEGIIEVMHVIDWLKELRARGLTPQPFHEAIDSAFDKAA